MSALRNTLRRMVPQSGRLLVLSAVAAAGVVALPPASETQAGSSQSCDWLEVEDLSAAEFGCSSGQLTLGADAGVTGGAVRSIKVMGASSVSMSCGFWDTAKQADGWFTVNTMLFDFTGKPMLGEFWGCGIDSFVPSSATVPVVVTFSTTATGTGPSIRYTWTKTVQTPPTTTTPPPTTTTPPTTTPPTTTPPTTTPPPPPPPPDRLLPGVGLGVNGSIVSSDGRFRIVLQADGNLVEYGPSGVLWATNTVGSGASNFVMQGDGNLVLYAGSRAVWSTRTDGNGGAYFVLQSDGNSVVYRASGGAIWASNTVQGSGGALVASIVASFVCDGASRGMGSLSGAAAGERITFTSPTVGGLLPGTASSSGTLQLIWSCNPNEAGQSWTVTARGASSGRSVTFTVRGVAAGGGSTPTPTPTPTPAPSPVGPPSGLPWAGVPFAANVGRIGADVSAWCASRSGSLSNVYVTYHFLSVTSTSDGRPACRYGVTSGGEYDAGLPGGVLPSFVTFVSVVVDFSALCTWYSGPTESYVNSNGIHSCTWSKNYMPTQRLDGRLNY